MFRTSRPTTMDTSLKAQFEMQSLQFAELLSDLQKVTVELDEERTSRQSQIDEACQASVAAAAAAEAENNKTSEVIKHHTKQAK